MQDGIYHVCFTSSSRDAGEGLAVIKQGSVNGGDLGYLYVGHLTDESGTVSGRITVKRWNPGHVSVFGPIEKFDLQLRGSLGAGGTFTVAGTSSELPNQSISIAGKFLAPAV